MKTIDIFLRALKNRLPRLGDYIPHYYVTPQKFPAIKEHVCEIYLIGEGENRIIVSESITEHDTTVEETESIKERLCQKVIERLLENYGL